MSLFFKKINRKEAFTLMEILLVLVLLGVVVTFTARNLFPTLGKGKIGATKLTMQALSGDLDSYRIDCGRYPSTAQGLQALLEAPTAAPLCKNYYSDGYLASSKKKTIPSDAWGWPFKYECDDGYNYKIISLGRDGEPGGDGENSDISSED